MTNNNKTFHDLRNEIVAIKMGLDIIRTKLSCDEGYFEFIDKIDQTMIRLNTTWTRFVSNLKECANQSALDCNLLDKH